MHVPLISQPIPGLDIDLGTLLLAAALALITWFIVFSLANRIILYHLVVGLESTIPTCERIPPIFERVKAIRLDVDQRGLNTLTPIQLSTLILFELELLE